MRRRFSWWKMFARPLGFPTTVRLPSSRPSCLLAPSAPPRSRSASCRSRSISTRRPSPRRACRSTCCTRSAARASSSSTSARRTTTKSSTREDTSRATSSRRTSTSILQRRGAQGARGEGDGHDRRHRVRPARARSTASTSRRSTTSVPTRAAIARTGCSPRRSRRPDAPRSASTRRAASSTSCCFVRSNGVLVMEQLHYADEVRRRPKCRFPRAT